MRPFYVLRRINMTTAWEVRLFLQEKGNQIFQGHYSLLIDRHVLFCYGTVEHLVNCILFMTS
jgi:hypothetical protein